MSEEEDRAAQRRVNAAHDRVSEIMSELLTPLFADEAELSFVMRVPGNPEATMVVTNDDLDEVAAAILSMKNVRPRP